MNRPELVALVARRSRIEPSVVDDVLQQTCEIISLTLAVDEEVAIRGFGKFRPSYRDAASLRNPKTGEPVTVGPKKSARFTPSILLKRRLNGAVPL